MKVELNITQLENCKFGFIIGEFNKKINKTAKSISTSWGKKPYIYS